MHGGFAVAKLRTTECGKHVLKMEEALNLWAEDTASSVCCESALSLHADVSGKALGCAALGDLLRARSDPQAWQEGWHWNISQRPERKGTHSTVNYFKRQTMFTQVFTTAYCCNHSIVVVDR